MKVISEYNLTKEEIQKYRTKGYEVYYGWEKPYIKPGESVGFLVDTIYNTTIDLIGTLLHRKTKSKITIKYKNQTYTITNPDEWESKYYNDNEHKWYRITHPILSTYYAQREEYFEAKQIEKKKEHARYVLEYFNQEIPEDLDSLLNTFAPLYDIQVDYDSLDSKLLAYASIKYYLDNDIEYSKDILGRSPEEESQFDCISFGDETYFEDYVYQNNSVIM